MANPTMQKFGYPNTLLREFEQWVVLIRPAQVTLGSLVLASKSDVTAFSDLPGEAFAELAAAVHAIESALSRFCDYERLNYLMLMMVDPNVHFHVIPRYSKPRQWNGLQFHDRGWPGPPQLKPAVDLDADQLDRLLATIRGYF